MDTLFYNECKICKKNDSDGGLDWFECDGFNYPNENGDIDLCKYCNDQIKYAEKDYLPGKRHGIKYIRKKRCKKCNFKLCYINNNIHCWMCWYLTKGPGLGGSGPISKLNQYPLNTINFGKYSGENLAFILQEDYSYCKWLSSTDYYKDSKLKKLIGHLEQNTFGELN